MSSALGIDFGTESARALLVDVADGTQLGSTVAAYEHGVVEAAPEWALQDPRDYVRMLA